MFSIPQKIPVFVRRMPSVTVVGASSWTTTISSVKLEKGNYINSNIPIFRVDGKSQYCTYYDSYLPSTSTITTMNMIDVTVVISSATNKLTNLQYRVVASNAKNAVSYMLWIDLAEETDAMSTFFNGVYEIL